MRGTPTASIAVLSGPNGTIENTAPLVTTGEGPGGPIRAQRLAAPSEVYIEAFTGHPLESEADELFAAPDAYLDDGVPVYKAVLRPEDGLYLLPYRARRRDGSPWTAEADEGDAEAGEYRQTFYPDARRLFEEIDRFALDDRGQNRLLGRLAEYEFYGVAPPGGKRSAERYFYAPETIARSPTSETLVHITNEVQRIADGKRHAALLWLEGSPTLEETAYWLSLVTDTTLPIACTAAQRRHGAIGDDGARNALDAVRYLTSRCWADSSGRDRIGAVAVADQAILDARNVRKLAGRPGGYSSSGVVGGPLGAVLGDGSVQLEFYPRRAATWRSELRYGGLPATVAGVTVANGAVTSCRVPTKDGEGRLRAECLPKVTVAPYLHYAMPGSGDVELEARMAANLADHPLAGFVLEGKTGVGSADEAMHASLARAAFSGMPVVVVGRSGHGDFLSRRLAHLPLVWGNDLSATKARLLLMACLLRLGALPPAEDPARPTQREQENVRRAVMRYQQLFDTH